MAVGQQGEVIVGVVNHEYGTVNYIIQVKMGNYITATSQPIPLSNEQQYEAPLTIVANAPHQNLEVQFLLFRQGDTVPYRSLHLWVNAQKSFTLSVSQFVHQH